MQSICAALGNVDPAKVEAAADKAVAGRWGEYAGGDRYFALWMALVNRRVLRRVGVGVLDIGDAPYRDYFDDGITPAEAASLALSEDDTFGMIDW